MARAIGPVGRALACALGLAVTAGARAAPAYDGVGKTLGEIERDLGSGKVTSAALVAAYRERIARLDHGPSGVHAVIALSPDADEQARAADARRNAGETGDLLGVPILVKDNIEVAGTLPTTAGSLALAANVTGRDAPIIHRLRAAGAVILGKTNLSEWANFRAALPVSGWSGVGGQTRNPYALDRSPCGSSSGSGAGVAGNFAAAAIGTETDGSITCPAAINGIAGIKPTVGLLSRTWIVPISRSQDTPGPMAPSVADLATLLTVMAGSDPADPATGEADRHREDYAKALDPEALKGRRIGVLRFLAGYHPETDAVFERALDAMRRAGATTVDITDYKVPDALGEAEDLVLRTEFKAGLAAYLASVPAGVPIRTLADAIGFNRDHAARELGLFGQELFEKAEATRGLDDPAYLAALERSRHLARDEALDRFLAGNDALVAPTGGPAWLIDAVNGDHVLGGATTLPAVAGYPHLSVPMGMVRGLPVGISFIGPAWSEARLLALGAALESRIGRLPPPGFVPSLAADASPEPPDRPGR